MWHGAQVAEAINLYSEDYGFDVDVKGFNWGKLVENRQAYIGRIHQSYDRVLGNNKVNVIKGFAKFVDEKTVEVNGEHYTADHILIAVGGRPTIPNIPCRIRHRFKWLLRPDGATKACCCYRCRLHCS